MRVCLVTAALFAVCVWGQQWVPLDVGSAEAVAMSNECLQVWSRSISETVALKDLQAAYSQQAAGGSYNFLMMKGQFGDNIEHRKCTLFTDGITSARHVESLSLLYDKENAADSLPGGYRSINVSDSRLAPIVTFCLEKLNEMSNSIHKFALDTVVSAEAQVVAGMNYRLVLRVVLDGTYSLHKFSVYDHFGKLTLVRHETVK